MLKEKAQIMDAKSMGRAVARISFEILERNKGTEDIGIVGIMSRGVQLAQRIAQKIAEVEGQHEEALTEFCKFIPKLTADHVEE